MIRIRITQLLCSRLQHSIRESPSKQRSLQITKQANGLQLILCTILLLVKGKIMPSLSFKGLKSDLVTTSQQCLTLKTYLFIHTECNTNTKILAPCCFNKVVAIRPIENGSEILSNEILPSYVMTELGEFIPLYSRNKMDTTRTQCIWIDFDRNCNKY